MQCLCSRLTKMILSRNEILMLNKGSNSVINRPIMACHNPDLDLVSIRAHAKFGQNPSGENRNSEVNDGPYRQKMIYNKPNLGLNVKVYAKFGQNPSIHSQDNEQK